MVNWIIKKGYLLILIALALLLYSFMLTGPSTMESLIRPISINEKGDILCRTKFTQNRMGAHRPMETTYGYGIITQDTFFQIQTALLDANGYPDYKDFYKHREYWDSVFMSCFDKNKLGFNAYNLAQEYNFNTCNVTICKIDKIVSLEEFESSRKIDLNKNPQKALNEAYSGEYFEEGKIKILYDFGYVVILENTGGDGLTFGADFSYFNGWTNDAGEDVNIGFDVIEVTGMLFLDK